MAKRVRKIVHIDEDRCDGCGLCVPACHEGAIEVVDGKARLVAEKLCDGLGDCLGHCPQDAIRIEERPADDFDLDAVRRHLEGPEGPASGRAACPASVPAGDRRGRGWPIQLALVPPSAPHLQRADILLAADCVPARHPAFHEEILGARELIIGCPKLDDPGLYVDRLAAILREGGVPSLGVAYMEVPCCSGLLNIAREAIRRSGRDVALWTRRIGVEGGAVGG